MLLNTKKLTSNTRVYGQLIASIIMSSYLGLISYFLTVFFSDKTYLRVNNVFLSFVIFSVLMAFVFPLIANNSATGLSYLRALVLWMLPIIYYSIGSYDLNNKIYERLLIIILVYSFFEFLMINFTGISFYESDRSRSAQVFGYVRSEGIAHNSSISSALVVSIFLKVFLEKGLSIKFLIVATLSIIILGSGAGMLLFIFAIVFFVLNKKILIILSILFFIFLYLFIQQPSGVETLQNIHPKISYRYISFLIELKSEQILEIFLNSDTLLFGQSIQDDSVQTSGDFGYLILISAIGLIPALFLLFGILMMFLRASHLGNFAPFLILMIETIHYPVMVDPLSAYILAQYAMAKRSEE